MEAQAQSADRECREDGFDLVLSLMGSKKVRQRHEVGASVSDLTISGCHIINISRGQCIKLTSKISCSVMSDSFGTP